MKKIKIKISLMMLTLSVTSFSYAATNLGQSVVTDPSISRRCEELVAKRNRKVTHKQKLLSLITRNKKLIRSAPLNKVKVKNKLRSNFKKLRNELKLTILQIKNLEESVVRRGCPGLTI